VPARSLPRLAIALAAALAFPAEPTRAELPGDPDPSFNGGQPVLLDLARGTPRRTWLNGAAVDAQGGIVVTGYASDENGKLGERLGSRAAARDIAAETRAVLVADTGALATEVESLAAAIP